MAIAHQSEILGASQAGTGAQINYDTAITPAAAFNGVCIIIGQTGSVADSVVSVTYGIAAGAVPVTERRFNTDPTEPGAVYIYWAAGVTFPTGAQTVRIVRTGASGITLRAAIYTMTVAAGQQVAVDVDNSAVSASAANPTVTLTTTVVTTQCYAGLYSGITTMTNTPATGWTGAPTPGFDDVGAFGRGWERRFFSTGPGNAAPGWTLSADDYVISAIAFKEVPLATAGTTPILVMASM